MYLLDQFEKEREDVYLAGLTMSLIAAILEKSSFDLKESNQIAQRCCKFVSIPTLNQSQNLKQLHFLLSLFAQRKVIDVEKTIPSLIHSIQKDTIPGVAKAVATLVIASDQNTQNNFIQ